MVVASVLGAADPSSRKCLFEATNLGEQHNTLPFAVGFDFRTWPLISHRALTLTVCCWHWLWNHRCRAKEKAKRKAKGEVVSSSDDNEVDDDDDEEETSEEEDDEEGWLVSGPHCLALPCLALPKMCI